MARSVRVRQWLYLAAVLLILGGAVGWNLYSAHSLIDARERQWLTTQAEIVEKNVTPQLLLANRVIENILKALPAWQAEKDGFKRANHELQVINDALIGIRPILVIKADGTVVASSNENLVGQNFAHREYFKTAINNPDSRIFHISAPFKTVLDTFVISLFRTIRGPHGEFAGIVIVSAVPEYFSILLDSIRYAPDMRTALIHGDGKLFLVMPARPDLEGTDLAKPGTFFSRHIGSGQKNSVSTGTLLNTGEERLVAMRTIEPDDLPMDKPLLLAVGRDRSRVFADWRRNAYLQGVLFLILVVTTTLGLYIYQQRLLEFNRLALTQSIGRKQVEDDLATEKAFIETALDSLVDTFFVFEPKTGKAIRWNKALKELTGYADEEIAALKSPDAYYSQDDLRKAASAIKAAVGGEQAVVELNLICKDGRTISMEYAATLVKGSPGNTGYLIVIGRNITERKQAELEILRTRNLLQATLDAIPDLLFEVGLDGHVYNYHAHRTDLLAAPPEVFMGRSFSEILPAEVAQVCLSAIREAAEHGWSTGKNYALQLPQGEFWFELSVAPMPASEGQERRFIILVRDITERKHKDSLFNSFLDNSQIIAWILNSQHQYVFVSDNFLRRFSLSSDGIIGKTHHDVWPKEMADQFVVNDMRLWAQGGSIEVVEHATQPRNSWWLSHKFVFNDPKGERMIGGLAVNITERIEQEQQRIGKEREHRVTLVREVHHRIKNNLQSVAGLLRRELGQFMELDPRLETAISQVNIIAVVHGLQGAELHEVTRLYDVVRNICTSVADLALRPVRFQEAAEDSAVRRIGIDKDEAVSVALVLNELVLNAVKHSPASGSAPRVSLRAVDDAVQVVICNATTAAPGFDIVSGKGISTGLSLVRSLMPERGAQLAYELDPQGDLVTSLKLASPVVFKPAEDATSANS